MTSIPHKLPLSNDTLDLCWIHLVPVDVHELKALHSGEAIICLGFLFLKTFLARAGDSERIIVELIAANARESRKTGRANPY